MQISHSGRSQMAKRKLELLVWELGGGHIAPNDSFGFIHPPMDRHLFKLSRFPFQYPALTYTIGWSASLLHTESPDWLPDCML